jgi:hypothetical protein
VALCDGTSSMSPPSLRQSHFRSNQANSQVETISERTQIMPLVWLVI